MWLGLLLHMSACIALTIIPFLLGTPVSRGALFLFLCVMCLIWFLIDLVCCYYALVYFWCTGAIILPDQGYIFYRGVSTFGDWMPYPDAVWDQPWSTGAIIFRVCFPSLLVIYYFLRSAILLSLHCAPNRNGLCIVFTLFFHQTSTCILPHISVSPSPLFLLLSAIFISPFFFHPYPIVPKV